MLYTYNVTLSDDSNYTGFILADNFKEANDKICRFCGEDIEDCHISLLYEADELEGVIPCNISDLNYLFRKGC